MRFEIERKRLADELQRYLPVLARKETIPVLSMLKLSVEEGGLWITGTDLDTSLTSSLAYDEGRYGATLVNGRQLAEIAKSAAGEVLTATLDGTRLVIECGRSKFRLPTEDVAQFPTWQDAPPVRWTIEGPALLGALSRISHAIAGDDSDRYSLKSLLAEFGRADGIRFVATDGHRLAVYDLRAESGEVAKVLIPRQSLLAIERILGEGPVEIGADEAAVSFASEGRLCVIRKAAGNFPAYELTLPTSDWRPVEVPRQPLVDAIRRVRIAEDGDSNRAVRFTLESSTLTVSGRSPRGIEADETIDLPGEAPSVTFGISAVYGLEWLAKAEGEKVVLKIKDAEAQVVFTEPDGSFLGVIMPVRLDVAAKASGGN